MPCIAGTRIPVAMLVRMIAAGTSVETILEDYPQLEDEDIREALRFAAAKDLDQIQLDPDDRTMRVVLTECEPDLDLDWEETPASVAFTASATRASDTGCADVQTIGLRDPLGDRTVTFNGVEVEPVVTEIGP